MNTNEHNILKLIRQGESITLEFEKCRKIAHVKMQNHPWADMDDMQLLQSSQLYQTDPQTKKSGVTLAGILLLGTDQLILSVVPAHRTDLILRKVNVDRYDDRDLVRTNLIDSYDRILAFVQKHLPDPFYLDGIERVSLRDVIFCEVASNMLIHREYTNATPARLIIEHGQVLTENANRPHGFGALNLTTSAPYPKNPVIGAFFREIHRADELGSGMRKLKRYGKAFGGAAPELIEGDVFRITIKVPEFSEVTPTGTTKWTLGEQKVGAHVVVHDETFTTTDLTILSQISVPRSTPELLASLGYARRTRNYESSLNKLLGMKLIERTVPEKPRSNKQKYRLTEKGRKLTEGFHK